MKDIIIKKWIYASKNSKNLSGCSFDFDLGDAYDSRYLEGAISDIFYEFGLNVLGVDFRSVKYPRGKVYSQAGIDFEWSCDTYDSRGIEAELNDFINDEGGNFFGIDFYSLQD